MSCPGTHIARARGLSDTERARLRAGFDAVRARRYRGGAHPAYQRSTPTVLQRRWAGWLAQLNSQRRPDESTLRRRAGIAQLRAALESGHDH